MMNSVTRTLSANDIHGIYAVTGLAHDRRAPSDHDHHAR